MWDIKNFPSKEELKNTPRETWALHLFEEELQRIQRSILFAYANERTSVFIFDMTDEAAEFLKEKDYTLSKTPDGTQIYLV